MNCNHNHTISGKEVRCSLSNLVENLPIDKSSLCIFHSDNIQWKKENDFNGFVVKLFNKIYSDKITSYGFHDFIFTGKNIIEEYSVENILYFNKILSRSTLTFYDCVFKCEVEIEQSVFKEALNFVNCKFEHEVTLNSCSFFEELNIFDNCHFLKKLAFYNMNIFKSNIQIVNSTFEEDLDIDNNQIHGALHIDENKFSMNHGLYLFANSLLGGFSLRNSVNVGLLNIIENEIVSDSLLSNINKNASMEISNNKYLGEFKIQGIEGNLMFNPNTVFELETEHLVGSASRIIFDYCDLLNLNEKALKTLTELEENEKVVFNDTNKMTRLRVVHIVDNRNIPEYLLTDIFVLVSRYFQHYFALQLSVSFQKLISKSQTKVIFTSNQLISIDEFQDTFEKCIVKVFAKNSFNTKSTEIILNQNNYDDIDEQTKNLLQRIKNFYKVGTFSPRDLVNALILDKKSININTIEIIMGDKNKFINSQIGAVGSNSQSHNNSFHKVNVTVPSNLDYNQLLAELEKLKTELVSKSETPENYLAVVEVANAEVAAKEKDGRKVISHLLKAGKWTLEIAKEIGVEVVANIISNQL